MSIEAINEQLLRAMGVGIALISARDKTLVFHNDVFAAWFEDAAPGVALSVVLPSLDREAMAAAIASTGHFTSEVQIKKKRRTLVLAQVFTSAKVGEDDILVLECQNVTRIRELESMIESYSQMVERNTRALQKEKEQVEQLLLNVMPRGAYEEYKAFGIVSPQKYDDVSVLSLDFTGFTDTIDTMPSVTFVSELNELYSAFDQIGDQFGCERIKTTGDLYLCVAGMDGDTEDHANAVAQAATRFVHYLRRRNENAETRWYCRIGLASGPVLGSIVGVQKYVYDVFGAAVTGADAARRLADRLEVVASREFAKRTTNLTQQPPLREDAAAADYVSLLQS